MRKKNKPTKSKAKAAPKPVTIPKKGKGLPLARVADIDKRAELQKQLEANACFPGQTPRHKLLPSILPDGSTEEQRAIQEAGSFAQRLLKEEDIFGAVHAMICMRQGYIVAYREYQELMTRKRQLAASKGEELPAIAEDFLVQYAMWQATKPFNEHQFMDLLLKTALPWLGETIDRHTSEDQKQDQEERTVEEQERRVRPLPIGFKHTPTQAEPVLERSRSLVLVGWYKAVLWLLDQVCQHVLAASERVEGHSYMIVRFMQAAPRREDQHRLLARIGGKAWAGCTDSDRQLALTMGEYVADKLTGQPDLLVCDHLPAAHTAGFVGRPDAAVAGDAQRRFRKWCDKAGAAFLGAVGLDDLQEIDVTEPTYEQLRTFSDLRVVNVVLDELTNKYLISIGHGATVIEADKNEVDACGRGALALPHGVDQIVT